MLSGIPAGRAGRVDGEVDRVAQGLDPLRADPPARQPVPPQRRLLGGELVDREPRLLGLPGVDPGREVGWLPGRGRSGRGSPGRPWGRSGSPGRRPAGTPRSARCRGRSCRSRSSRRSRRAWSGPRTATGWARRCGRASRGRRRRRAGGQPCGRAYCGRLQRRAVLACGPRRTPRWGSMRSMCDTFVVLPDATARGEVLLAKNSDREPNEAQQLVLLPASRPPRGRRRALHLPRHPPGRPHPRRAALPAVLDVGRRDGGQRARRGHRQRGRLHPSAAHEGAGAPRHGPAPAGPGAGRDGRGGG